MTTPMIKYCIFYVYIFISATSAFAADPVKLSTLVSDSKGLQILSGIADETCGICVKQQLKNAFGMLNIELKTGKIISTSTTCLFEKSERSGVNELNASCYSNDAACTNYPLLSFRFHTREVKLVGISLSDLTEKEISSEYEAYPDGLFEGNVRIIKFQYGDGDSFDYFENTHHLLIHCKILKLKRVTR